MKLIAKRGLVMMIITLTFLSCKRDKELLFNEPGAIYVTSLPDSTVFTFATSPDVKVTDTVLITYRIIGNAAAKDRQIRLEPRDGATAKAGYHYKIGPALVKANAFSATVPVYVYRKPGLKDSTVNVILDIKENADFKPGFTNQLRYKISISDVLSKPTIWDAVWASYFGSYSVVKFKFLLAVTGKTNWNSSPLPQDSRYLSQKAKNELLAYNQAHGPLIDEFGIEVTFP
ncbi:DUF4843 domain-containing protein [Pedobacter sp.]|jgi:hypothetical protein|uniref:DUF4843 domain-containing protein n=1 Tax=Pedobacter sp. TaxID=1411316 RepID=UPI002CB60750|nr:DUF4843 domain-containing protein [Pedobacter sp.]HWW39785.1 DUF4843 domain-containing protein [Pedobacter sp.]